jgi:hypothetical protein
MYPRRLISDRVFSDDCRLGAADRLVALAIAARINSFGAAGAWLMSYRDIARRTGLSRRTVRRSAARLCRTVAGDPPYFERQRAGRSYRYAIPATRAVAIPATGDTVKSTPATEASVIPASGATVKSRPARKTAGSRPQRPPNPISLIQGGVSGNRVAKGYTSGPDSEQRENGADDGDARQTTGATLPDENPISEQRVQPDPHAAPSEAEIADGITTIKADIAQRKQAEPFERENRAVRVGC